MQSYKVLEDDIIRQCSHWKVKTSTGAKRKRGSFSADHNKSNISSLSAAPSSSSTSSSQQAKAKKTRATSDSKNNNSNNNNKDTKIHSLSATPTPTTTNNSGNNNNSVNNADGLAHSNHTSTNKAITTTFVDLTPEVFKQHNHKNMNKLNSNNNNNNNNNKRPQEQQQQQQQQAVQSAAGSFSNINTSDFWGAYNANQMSMTANQFANQNNLLFPFVSPLASATTTTTFPSPFLVFGSQQPQQQQLQALMRWFPQVEVEMNFLHPLLFMQLQQQLQQQQQQQQPQQQQQSPSVFAIPQEVPFLPSQVLSACPFSPSPNSIKITTSFQPAISEAPSMVVNSISFKKEDQVFDNSDNTSDSNNDNSNEDDDNSIGDSDDDPEYEQQDNNYIDSFLDTSSLSPTDSNNHNSNNHYINKNNGETSNNTKLSTNRNNSSSNKAATIIIKQERQQPKKQQQQTSSGKQRLTHSPSFPPPGPADQIPVPRRITRSISFENTKLLLMGSTGLPTKLIGMLDCLSDPSSSSSSSSSTSSPVSSCSSSSSSPCARTLSTTPSSLRSSLPLQTHHSRSSAAASTKCIARSPSFSAHMSTNPVPAGPQVSQQELVDFLNSRVNINVHITATNLSSPRTPFASSPSPSSPACSSTSSPSGTTSALVTSPGNFCDFSFLETLVDLKQEDDFC